MAECARIKIRVQPRASRNEAAGWREDTLYLRLTAPPVEGAANRACVELLADLLRVKGYQVRIVSGEKSRDKVVEIEGLIQEEAEKRLSSDPP